MVFTGEPNPVIPMKERIKIIALRSQRWTFGDIAREVGASESGVRKVWNRYQERGLLDDLPRSGAPRKISPQNIKKMKTRFKTHHIETAREGREWLASEGEPGPVHVSTSTVQRTMKREKFRPFKKRSVTVLNAKQCAERVRLCKQWREEDMDWSSVVFTDETTVRDAPRGRVQWQWLPEKTPPEQRGTKRKAPFGGKTIRLWAAITPDGVLSWQVLEGHLRSEEYQDLLKVHLFPSARRKFGRAPWIFQQDNAGEHVSTSTRNWLLGQSTRRAFRILEWPPLSPDLNPIENLWSEVLEHIAQFNHLRLSKKKLTELVGNFFASKEVAYFRNLYESMLARVEKVIKAGGARIAY